MSSSDCKTNKEQSIFSSCSGTTFGHHAYNNILAEVSPPAIGRLLHGSPRSTSMPDLALACVYYLYQTAVKKRNRPTEAWADISRKEVEKTVLISLELLFEPIANDELAVFICNVQERIQLFLFFSLLACHDERFGVVELLKCQDGI